MMPRNDAPGLGDEVYPGWVERWPGAIEHHTIDSLDAGIEIPTQQETAGDTG